MTVHASCKNVKGSVKKLTAMVCLVKGVSVGKAAGILTLSRRTTAIYFKKILMSAISNAENKGYDVNKLVVKNVIIEKTLCLKRIIARSKGRAGKNYRKYSNVKFILDEGN